MFQGNMDNLPAQQLRLLQKLCNGKAQGRRSHNIIDTWTSSLHYLGLGDDDRLGPYITLVLGAVSLIAKANAVSPRSSTAITLVVNILTLHSWR